MRLSRLVFVAVASCLLLAASPQSAGRTVRDLRAYQLLENAQGQIDDWCGRLAARLRRGESPTETDPVLDGRVLDQIQRIRGTYAPWADDDQLRALMLALAAADEARLEGLQDMALGRFSERRYRRLDERVEHYLERARNWRKRR